MLDCPALRFLFEYFAEAEGLEKKLLAEAEGLRKKVEAQNQINQQVILQELIKQLPAIAAEMQVGDVSWLNMGGSGGDSPMSIIPKNLMELLGVARGFGLDIDGLVSQVIKKGKGAEKALPIPVENGRKKDSK